MYRNKYRLIAYYLPQFHPIPENDMWWGKGFTEWTNVGKASKLYHNHYQPKVPSELGYYDLRNPETQILQADLAKEAGVEGFCYWHYWFGNGKELLEKPFQNVLHSKTPDYPFCLAWANESWYAKIWNNIPNKKNKLLIQQTYPEAEDIDNHFFSVLPALQDPRYITVEEKPLFVIYKPFDLPNPHKFINRWNELALQNGLKGIYFVGHWSNTGMDSDSEVTENIIACGFDAVNIVRRYASLMHKNLIYRNLIKLKWKLLHQPRILNYQEILDKFTNPIDRTENVFPTIIPNWDHTPRSGKNGLVYHNATPELFGKHVGNILNTIENKPKEKRIAFIKSWNEWGEGNYMEPDLKYGRGYIEELNRQLILHS